MNVFTSFVHFPPPTVCPYCRLFIYFFVNSHEFIYVYISFISITTTKMILSHTATMNLHLSFA